MFTIMKKHSSTLVKNLKMTADKDESVEMKEWVANEYLLLEVHSDYTVSRTMQSPLPGCGITH